MCWLGLVYERRKVMNFIEYVKQIWKNGPGGGTPCSAARLNHMGEQLRQELKQMGLLQVRS